MIYNRKFYNYTATHYRLWVVSRRWSAVQDKILIKENIKVALWAQGNSYRDTMLATQTDMNRYKVNMTPDNDIHLWDLLYIDWNYYKIENIVKHHNHRGTLDNFDLTVSITTQDD